MKGLQMSEPINPNKIVVFTGAGVSAESGLKTFRDFNGLWNNYSIYQVATPQAWRADPQLVLDFYNMRRSELETVEPNPAHIAIAQLESQYEVVVITQNVDNLHERAGSSNVIHVHGELTKVRPEVGHDIIDIGTKPIQLGDLAPNGYQLRPHIVWFGEEVLFMEECREHLETANKVLVVGSSLTVFPAAGLLNHARFKAEKIIVSMDVEKVPFGYKFLRGKAGSLVPVICENWINKTHQ
jgi:NAD-dependent deacetylase